MTLLTLNCELLLELPDVAPEVELDGLEPGVELGLLGLLGLELGFALEVPEAEVSLAADGVPVTVTVWPTWALRSTSLEAALRS